MSNNRFVARFRLTGKSYYGFTEEEVDEFISIGHLRPKDIRGQTMYEILKPLEKQADVKEEKPESKYYRHK